VIETVIMHMEQGPVQEYVVKTDPGAVARMRASLLRTLPVSAWATAVIAVIMLLALTSSLYIRFAAGIRITSGLDVFGLIVKLMLAGFVALLVHDAKRRFAVTRRLKQTWSVKEISPVALRVTAEGLWCAVDAAPEPVVLPWAAVTHLQVKGRERFSVLLVALAPGAAAAPGVSGLDQPEVRSRTRRSLKGVSRLYLAVFSLRQSVSEIDQALGHFSGGRVRVR
jgi:hypothetical protein